MIQFYTTTNTYFFSSKSQVSLKESGGGWCWLHSICLESLPTMQFLLSCITCLQKFISQNPTHSPGFPAIPWVQRTPEKYRTSENFSLLQTPCFCLWCFLFLGKPPCPCSCLSDGQAEEDFWRQAFVLTVTLPPERLGLFWSLRTPKFTEGMQVMSGRQCWL